MGEDRITKQETRTDAILTRLTTLKEERQKLINVIGECVSRLQAVTEPPTEPRDKEATDEGFLSSVEEHLDILKGDNEKLELIRVTLQKII